MNWGWLAAGAAAIALVCIVVRIFFWRRDADELVNWWEDGYD